MTKGINDNTNTPITMTIVNIIYKVIPYSSMSIIRTCNNVACLSEST